jgi:hypothetical protein
LAAWVAALALGAVTGLVVAGLSALEPTPGAAIGVAAAVAAAAGVAFVQRTARPRRQLALALPILLAGPVAFVLGRLLVG